jgi:hemerythrin-like domain-containing protein
MKPTQELVQEHKAIEQMLAILETACTRLEGREVVETDDLARMIEFFRVFADGCHHTKEEELLFPALECAGVGREHGPIGVMLHEHVTGRNHIRQMSDALATMTRGDAEATACFVGHAHAYINLLAAHIQKENFVLFPMADRLLTEEQQRKLEADFERIETERIGKEKHEEFHRLLDTLESVYS